MESEEEESAKDSNCSDFLERHFDNFEDDYSLTRLNSFPDALVAQVARLLLSFGVLGSLLVAEATDVVCETFFPGQLLLDKFLVLPK